MVTVVRWSGREARVLRDALRMSVRDFAAHTNLSASSIADLEAKSEHARPRRTTQRIFDEVLATASEQARRRFCVILGSMLPPTHAVADPGDSRVNLVPDPRAPAGTRGQVGEFPLLMGTDSGPRWLDGLIVGPGADTLVAERDDGMDGVLFQEFAMAAGETARFLQRADVTVSSDHLGRLRREVDHLAREYLRRPPYAVFASISALRREVFSVLDRHVPAQHLSELYLCAGELTALLAHASADLGQPVVAEAHARTAWLCGELAGSDPLRAYVRWVQSNIAYWAGQYRQAAEVAAEGRRYATVGSSRLRLASQEARAWAACGDQPALARALSTVRDERDRLPGDTDEVGAFHFGAGKAAYYAAEAWLAAGGVDNARRARTDAGEAYELLTAEPEACAELVAAAQLDLATAQVALGELEEAGDTLRQVLALPAERRTVPVTQRAVRVNEALLEPEVAESRVGHDLAEQVGLFVAYPATRELTT